MNFEVTHSISTKLTKLSFLIALLIGVSLSLVQIFLDLNQQSDMLETNVAQIMRVSKPTASQAVYYLDQNVAQNLVNGLYDYDFIKKVKIIDDDGMIMAFSQPGDNEDRSFRSSLLGLMVPQFSLKTQKLFWAESKKENHGLLQITINQHIALRSFLKRAQFVLITGILGSLLFAFILLWVSKRLLGIPLSQLAHDLQNIDMQKTNKKRMEIPDNHKYDELGRLAWGINQYIDSNEQFQQQLVIAEREAKINETLYRDVAESAADWFWEMDSKLQFVTISEKFYDLCGFSEEEVKKKSRQGLMWSHNAADTRKNQAHLSLLESHQPFRDFEYDVLTKLGQKLPVRINGKPIFNLDGEFTGYRGTGIDLTREVKAKRIQFQRDSMLLGAAEIAHLGYVIWSGEELNLETVSTEYATIFGYTREAFEKQISTFEHQLDNIHEDDRGSYVAHISAQTEKGNRFEYRILKADSTIRFIIGWSRRVEDSNGFQQKIITIQDITDIKQTEQLLFETEGRFRHLYESSLAAMATFLIVGEDDLSILSCNSAFALLFGYENKQDACQNFLSSNHWHDLGALSSYLHVLKDHGEVSNYEISHIRQDGTLFWAGVSTRLVPKQSKFESVIIDITEQKQAQATLKEQHQQMERLVEQRTAELQRINEDQKTFSYSVSHDLRQPLRAINGFSEALMEDCYDSLNDLGKDYLNRVCQASSKMGDLIDSLLKLSRLSRQSMLKERVFLDKIANREIENLPDLKQRKQSEFIIQKDMQVEGDLGLLKVLLMNLLSNAWKYSRKQKYTKIEFGSYIEDGKDVFYLRDNGVGFNMQYADKLFGEFQRLHNSDEFEGIGIGLATVKRIIVRHGGKIWAVSKVNKGTTFFFTLS